MATWHYTAKSTSFGPVSAEDIRALYAAGKINDNTLLWNGSDRTEWTRYIEVPEFRGGSAPPIPASAVSDIWIWILVAVPIVGTIAEAWLANSYGFTLKPMETIILYSIVNCTLAYFDSEIVKKSGRSTNFGWAILVPIYLYMRSKRVGKPQHSLLVYVFTFVATIFLASGNFRVPFQFAASLPTCNDTASIDQIKEMFPRIPLNLANIPALDLKDIKTVSSSDDLVSCRATVIARGGTEMNVTYTITPQDGQFMYALNLAF